MLLNGMRQLARCEIYGLTIVSPASPANQNPDSDGEIETFSPPGIRPKLEFLLFLSLEPQECEAPGLVMRYAHTTSHHEP